MIMEAAIAKFLEEISETLTDMVMKMRHTFVWDSAQK
jgi:hypothetical protein